MAAARDFHGTYEIIEKIGEGGFGSVFKVQRRSDGACFATKEIDYANFSSTKQKLITFETELLSILQHPTIAGLKELYDDTKKETLHIVMEMFERGDLKKFIKDMRVQLLCISEAQIWLFLEQILSALAYMHEGRMDPIPCRKILHRDIKPENIVITNEGYAKLIDFGICKELVDCSVTYTRCGTSQYAAPEVFVKHPSYDEKIDIWALGCVTYELAMAKALFQADSKTPPSITEAPEIRLPGFSPMLAEFVSWMVVIDPGMRPSASQLLVYLQSLRLEKETLSASKFGQRLVSSPLYHAPGLRLDARLNRQDRTDLQLMAAGGQTSVVKDSLLTSLRCVNNNGRTALHTAAEAGKKFVVKALIPYEAGILDNDGDTALSIAVRKGHMEIADLLVPGEGLACISKGTGSNDTDEFTLTPLMWATIENDLGSVYACIKQKLYIGAQTDEGMTALMYAAQTGSVDCCRMLLDLEAGMKTIYGETALSLAIEGNHPEIVNLLFEKEIKITLEAEKMAQHTMLELSAFTGDTSTMLRLIPHYSTESAGDPMLYSVLAQHVEASASLQLKGFGSLTDNLRYLSTIIDQIDTADSPAITLSP